MELQLMKQCLLAVDVELALSVYSDPDVAKGLMFDKERVQGRPAWSSIKFGKCE